MDKDKYFSDYDVCTENEILEITAQGIALKGGMYIDFAKCAEVWTKVNSPEESRCVGERDAYGLQLYFLCFTQTHND